MVTTVGAFLTPFMGSSLTVALPAIGRDFAMTAVLLGWIPTSYVLATAAVLVPFGKVGDIYGRKRIYVLGTLVVAVASLLSALAPSAFWLLVFRVVAGVGSAMIFGTGLAIVTAVFPPGERGRAMGINVAAVYLGASLGPVLGGLLTERLGWRSVFLAAFVLGVVIVGLFLWKIRAEWVDARRERFDYPGSAVYATALVALMWGFSRLPGTSGAVLIAVGAGGLIVFGWWEARARYPIVNMDLFRRNRVFALSNAAGLINYSATFAVSFLLSLYLQYIKKYTAETAGLVLLVQPAMQAAVSPFAGRLSDRVEARVVASVGMGLTVAGLVVLASLGDHTSIALVVAALGVLGLGFGLFSSPNTNTIMSSVEPRFLGVAAATLSTMRMTGQMFSMGIAMLVFALAMGTVQITPAVYSSFLTSVRTAFGIFAVLCFAGIFASLARGTLRQPGEAEVRGERTG
ncbi:MAG: MFS transporter [Thermoleophilia bacterium]